MNRRQRDRFIELLKKDPARARQYWEQRVGLWLPALPRFVESYWDDITTFARVHCRKNKATVPLYSKLTREYTYCYFNEAELFVFWKLLRLGFWSCLAEKWGVFDKNTTFEKFKKYLDKLK